MNKQRIPVSRPFGVDSLRPPASTAGSRRAALAAVIAPAALLLASVAAPSARGDAIFVPTDPILGGKENTTTHFFDVGVTGTAAGANNWPAAESPNHTIDGVAGKYLNFGKEFTGILVNPAFNGGNGSVVTSMQLWTANDSEPRDPSSYEIWGTNAPLDFFATSFDMSLFTQISTGGLALPTGRGGAGTTALNNNNSQTVSFINPVGYKEYLIVFPTVKTTASANSMQIGEVQLFGSAAFTSLKWTGSASSIWNVSASNWSASGSPSAYNDTSGVTFDDTSSATATSITVQNSGTGVKPAGVIFQNNTLNYTIGGEAILSPGSLAVNGKGTVTFNNANNYAGGIVINAGTVNVGTTGNLGTGPLAVNNINTGAGSAVALNFSSAQTVGTLSGSISTPSTGANTSTINLNGALTVSQGTDAIYAGVIAGTGGLVKNGNGALTLTGVNTYAGPTTINAGILRSSAPGDNDRGALPAGQPVVVNTGATLLFGTDDGAGYYSGSVSSITVNGGSVVSATGTHSTLPALTLNGGTLSSVGAGNSFGFDPAVVNYILDGDVTTVASNTPSTISANTILLRKDGLNTGTSSALTFNVPRGTAATDLAISSVIADKTAGLIKSGNGILALSGTNTYTGPTVISGGTVAVTNSSALGTGSVTINNGATLSLGAAPAVSGFQGFSLNGGAAADITNTTVTLTDNVANEARSVFSPTQVSLENGFAANFIYQAAGNRAADGFTFTIQNSAPTAVGAGGGSLGYVGIASSAAVEFNLYTGAATPQPVGTRFGIGTVGQYISSNPVNLASGNPISISLVYNPAAQTLTETLVDLLTRGSYTSTFPNVNYANAIGGTSGYVGFTGATGGAVSTQTVSNFSFNNFTQGVSLTNDIAVAAGAGVTLDVLPISAGGAGAATLQGNLTLGANATLNITGGAIPTNTPYLLTVAKPTVIAGATSFNVANNGTGIGSLVLSDIGAQAAGATLTKTGSGSLTIAGAATYTGTTNVNAGTLVVNGSISGATAVNNGGFLAGTGNLAAVSVGNGGTLAPGNGIGTLHTGPLSLQNGASFSLEMDATTADQVALTGGGTLTGVINLALSLFADPVDGTSFTLLNGSAPLTGYSGGARFSYLGTPLGEGQQFSVTSNGFTQLFSITYVADGGRDVALFAVIPEPGTAGLLLTGAALAAGFRRRRR